MRQKLFAFNASEIFQTAAAGPDRTSYSLATSFDHTCWGEAFAPPPPFTTSSSCCFTTSHSLSPFILFLCFPCPSSLLLFLRAPSPSFPLPSLYLIIYLTLVWYLHKRPWPHRPVHVVLQRFRLGVRYRRGRSARSTSNRCGLQYIHICVKIYFINLYTQHWPKILGTR